jgi:hypothetical protein
MIILNKDQIAIATKALMNAWGYPLGDTIEKELGFKRSELHSLMVKIRDLDVYELNDIESDMINSSLAVCLKYIDDWEFPATFDFEKQEVQEFYDELREQ